MGESHDDGRGKFAAVVTSSPTGSAMTDDWFGKNWQYIAIVGGVVGIVVFTVVLVLGYWCCCRRRR